MALHNIITRLHNRAVWLSRDEMGVDVERTSNALRLKVALPTSALRTCQTGMLPHEPGTFAMP
jgi:hypothetical protein